jgi:hypothetical protein
MARRAIFIRTQFRVGDFPSRALVNVHNLFFLKKIGSLAPGVNQRAGPRNRMHLAPPNSGPVA